MISNKSVYKNIGYLLHVYSIHTLYLYTLHANYSYIFVFNLYFLIRVGIICDYVYFRNFRIQYKFLWMYSFCFNGILKH